MTAPSKICAINNVNTDGEFSLVKKRQTLVWKLLRENKKWISIGLVSDALSADTAHNNSGTPVNPKATNVIYIYGAPILDVSRSHTTTQHSR